MLGAHARQPAAAALLALLAACASASVSEEVRNATLYYPPQVRLVDEPRSCFTHAERQRALLELSRVDADTLFELIVDEEGKVVRARLLRTHVRREYHEQLEDHARAFEFTPEDCGGRYRAFFFPCRYRHDAGFEWV